MIWLMRFIPIFLLFVGLLPSALAAESLRIYAAASLTEVLQKVALVYAPKEKILFNFDASSKLAHQIKSGAPADLFFSADTDWMDFLDTHGRIFADSRKDLLTNRIVLIVRAGAKETPGDVQDLLKPTYQRIALAAEAVPAGKFGRSALRHQGLDPQKIQGKTVNADNVKVALKWVAMGEAQAAIVYQTDAFVTPEVKVALVFPEVSHPKIIYPASIVKQTNNKKEAQAFLDFCHSDKAKEIFKQAGFSPL